MDNFSFGEVNVPENANILESSMEVLNPLNMLLFAVPIVLIILIPFIIKQRKFGLLNKEYRNKMQKEEIEKHNLNTVGKQAAFGIKRFLLIFLLFFIFMSIIVTPLHEFLHAIPGAFFGADMKVGFMPQNLIAVAMTSSPLTKLQFLIVGITPIIVLGIIPAIVIAIGYPKKIKNPKISWILMCMCISMILSAGPDLVCTYNIMTNVPNGAIIQQTDNETYWYMP